MSKFQTPYLFKKSITGNEPEILPDLIDDQEVPEGYYGQSQLHRLVKVMQIATGDPHLALRILLHQRDILQKKAELYEREAVLVEELEGMIERGEFDPILYTRPWSLSYLNTEIQRVFNLIYNTPDKDQIQVYAAGTPQLNVDMVLILRNRVWIEYPAPYRNGFPLVFVLDPLWGELPIPSNRDIAQQIDRDTPTIGKYKLIDVTFHEGPWWSVIGEVFNILDNPTTDNEDIQRAKTFFQARKNLSKNSQDMPVEPSGPPIDPQISQDATPIDPDPIKPPIDPQVSHSPTKALTLGQPIILPQKSA